MFGTKTITILWTHNNNYLYLTITSVHNSCYINHVLILHLSIIIATDTPCIWHSQYCNYLFWNILLKRPCWVKNSYNSKNNEIATETPWVWLSQYCNYLLWNILLKITCLGQKQLQFYEHNCRCHGVHALLWDSSLGKETALWVFP